MFRLNFWSHQSLTSPVTSSLSPGIGVPNTMGLPAPFYAGPLIGLPSHPSLASSHPSHPSQTLLPDGTGTCRLQNSPSGDPVTEFNVAAAASLWRHGLAHTDRGTARATSPDTNKRLSPAEFNRAFQSATMTSFPVGHPGSLDHVGSPSIDFRQSLLLRSQLIALRQYQQQQEQIEAIEMAKYQFLDNNRRSASCSSPDSPPPMRTDSAGTSACSDADTHDHNNVNRKRMRKSIDNDYCNGSEAGDDVNRSCDNAAFRIGSPGCSTEKRSLSSSSSLSRGPSAPAQCGPVGSSGRGERFIHNIKPTPCILVLKYLLSV